MAVTAKTIDIIEDRSMTNIGELWMHQVSIVPIVRLIMSESKIALIEIMMLAFRSTI